MLSRAKTTNAALSKGGKSDKDTTALVCFAEGGRSPGKRWMDVIRGVISTRKGGCELRRRRLSVTLFLWTGLSADETCTEIRNDMKRADNASRLSCEGSLSVNYIYIYILM